MAEYNSATSSPNYLLAVAGLGFMLLVTAVLLKRSNKKQEMPVHYTKKVKGRRGTVRIRH